MRLIGLRLLTIVPVLVGVSLCTFFVLAVLPGDAAEQLLGPDATTERVEQMRAELNLKGTPWDRYAYWLRRAAQGDLGKSLANGLPVTTLVRDRLPVTLQLLSYSFLIALAFALPAALLAARRPHGITDRLSTIVSMAGLAIPNYVLAVLLVYVFAVVLPLFPSMGYTPAHESIARNIASLVLPAIAIAVPLFGFYTQFLRGDLVEQVQREAYVVTAAAKGIGPWRVLVRHALRNSLFGLLTVVGLNVGALLGSTVIIEQIFSLPGVGQLLLQAVNTRDVGVVQGIVLLLGFATVTANLVVDVLYGILDPRIRYPTR